MVPVHCQRRAAINVIAKPLRLAVRCIELAGTIVQIDTALVAVTAPLRTTAQEQIQPTIVVVIRIGHGDRQVTVVFMAIVTEHVRVVANFTEVGLRRPGSLVIQDTQTAGVVADEVASAVVVDMCRNIYGTVVIDIHSPDFVQHTQRRWQCSARMSVREAGIVLVTQRALRIFDERNGVCFGVTQHKVQIAITFTVIGNHAAEVVQGALIQRLRGVTTVRILQPVGGTTRVTITTDLRHDVGIAIAVNVRKGCGVNITAV